MSQDVLSANMDELFQQYLVRYLCGAFFFRFSHPREHFFSIVPAFIKKKIDPSSISRKSGIVAYATHFIYYQGCFAKYHLTSLQLIPLYAW